jgi:hypothetical protein
MIAAFTYTSFIAAAAIARVEWSRAFDGTHTTGTGSTPNPRSG